MKYNYLVTETDLDDLKKQLSTISSQVNEMKNKSEVKRWLSEEQAQSITGMCDKTLRKYRQNGVLPYSKIGRKIFYSGEDLDKFISTGYQKSGLSEFLSRRKQTI